MTLKDAIRLESQCEYYITNSVGIRCQISLTLTNRIRVHDIDEGNSFMFSRDLEELEYVEFKGAIVELLDTAQKILRVMQSHRKDFEQLLWSYDNRSELTR